MNRFPYLILGIFQRQLTNTGNLLCEVLGYDGNLYPVTGLYGDGIDQNTENIHGTLKIPRDGQVMGLLCEKGNLDAPYACFPMPYTPSHDLEYLYDMDKLFETADGGTFDDIFYSHYVGQRMLQRQDGKLELQSKVISDDRSTIIVHEDGKVEVTSLEQSGTPSKITMGADGKIEITHHTGAVVTMETSGKITLIPDSGQTVEIGGGARGMARLNDTTIANVATSSAFWAWFTSVGTATAVGPPPAALNGKINSASTKGYTD